MGVATAETAVEIGVETPAMMKDVLTVVNRTHAYSKERKSKGKQRAWY